MTVKEANEKCQVGDTMALSACYDSRGNYIPNGVKKEITKIETFGRSLRLYFDQTNKKGTSQGKFYAYITVSNISQLYKNKSNIKPSKERFAELIFEKEVIIKKWLGEIEKEKAAIAEVRSKIEFIDKFKTDKFDDNKYKAYKLIQAVNQLRDGQLNETEAIFAVSKII